MQGGSPADCRQRVMRQCDEARRGVGRFLQERAEGRECKQGEVLSQAECEEMGGRGAHSFQTGSSAPLALLEEPSALACLVASNII